MQPTSPTGSINSSWQFGMITSSQTLKSALIVDFNPLRWLTRYKRTSYPYLTIMFLFYVGIGYLSSIAVDVLISTAAPDYEEPEINPSLLMLLNAGPSEESLAFGIPYYASGNVYIVLVTGIIWASVHLFNTQFLDVGHLAYGNLVFALCYLFFSLRTWASGMGWFSIIAHSTFDGIAFLQSCISGKSCTINEPSDFFMIALSFILLFVTYYLYAQRKFKDENKKMQARPALVGSPIFPLSDVACRNCG